MCWPRDAPTSSACFATSKELLDHCKTIHVKDPSGDKPFKCALAGCGKSWKASRLFCSRTLFDMYSTESERTSVSPAAVNAFVVVPACPH